MLLDDGPGLTESGRGLPVSLRPCVLSEVRRLSGISEGLRVMGALCNGPGLPSGAKEKEARPVPEGELPLAAFTRRSVRAPGCERRLQMDMSSSMLRSSRAALSSKSPKSRPRVEAAFRTICDFGSERSKTLKAMATRDWGGCTRLRSQATSRQEEVIIRGRSSCDVSGTRTSCRSSSWSMVMTPRGLPPVVSKMYSARTSTSLSSGGLGATAREVLGEESSTLMMGASTSF
mmetsp:Transcript_12014/g.37593  ORF Transcript_12014/g.37593 Transcript_12014/m.37593 type:complete len:232 (-) Transcript_12014:1688-2383(-)